MSMDLEARRDHSPIYCQIAEAIRKTIFRGELSPMARLPAENELCSIYGASRITIRAALKKLETEGLIHRVNGKGTFVSELKDKTRQIILVLERDPGELRHLHELVMGALVKAQESGISVLVSTSAQFRGFLDEALANPARQTAALLLRCRDIDMEDIAFAEKRGVPCLLEACERLKGLNWIAVDNEGAMRGLVDHMHGLGRRKFGLLSCATPYSWSSFKEREEAALARLEEIGIPKKSVFVERIGLDEQANDAMSRIFKGGRRPDALLCVNDVIALQALKLLSEKGLRVPDDVAVSGFDDSPLAAYAQPPLTTAIQNYYEAGRFAVEQLRLMMDDFDNKRIQIVRKLELAIRRSTDAAAL